MPMPTATSCKTQPRVNGQPIAHADESPDDASLRQRACTELLRQAAQAQGLLRADDTPSEDGVLSQDACDAIERLLEQVLLVPEPDEAACRRHHAAQAASYRRGERVRLRHILFAVTPGVDIAALRTRAEQLLLEVRSDDTRQLFATRAAALSNCPTGAQGGDLDWLTATDCAPEFGREVFGQAEVGVLPRLVHSRFGLHVVEVLQRDAGEALPFEAVKDAVRLTLRQHSWSTALRQYLQLLAGQARLQGVQLDASDSPLVQ
jgi:peptidyl-prolyl cis-trans isomerase C